MLSVAGIEKVKIDQLCEQARTSVGGGAVCQVANVLFPKGLSVAGNANAITKMKELAEDLRRLPHPAHGIGPGEAREGAAGDAPEDEAAAVRDLHERHGGGDRAWYLPAQDHAP